MRAIKRDLTPFPLSRPSNIFRGRCVTKLLLRKSRRSISILAVVVSVALLSGCVPKFYWNNYIQLETSRLKAVEFGSPELTLLFAEQIPIHYKMTRDAYELHVKHGLGSPQPSVLLSVKGREVRRIQGKYIGDSSDCFVFAPRQFIILNKKDPARTIELNYEGWKDGCKNIVGSEGVRGIVRLEILGPNNGLIDSVDIPFSVKRNGVLVEYDAL